MQQLYTYICRIHIDTMNKDERHSSYKNIPLTLLKGFEKGCSSFYCDRELETEQDCNILTPTLMAISIVSFSFSRAAPGGLGATLLGVGFLYRILSLTCLISNLIGGPEGPLYWEVAFPTATCLQLIWSPTHWLPVLTELYNSSIAHSIFRMACLIIIKRK